jgi:hypothetical protein
MNQDKTQKGKKFAFLFEQTCVVSNSQIEILEETYTADKKPKLVFKSRLQESDVKNQNKRRYKSVVCESIVDQLSPKAKSRNLLMEVDHPLFNVSDPNQLKQRAGIIEIKNCGALIKEITFNNGNVIGLIETLSGFLGPHVANLVSKDKIDIGFSLRALGGVTPLTDGTLEVNMPIRAITYDIVSNPSHQNSRIIEFLPESDMSMSINDSILAESGDLELLESLDNITLSQVNNNYCIRTFTDDLIHETFLNIINKGLRFHI